MARGDRLRRSVRRLHLWLGLGLGGLFALLGLTGSVLVFYPQIDALLHPAIASGWSERAHEDEDWDRAVATLRAAYPDKQGSWRIEVTGTPGAIPARYYDPPERKGHSFRPMMVWLSPDGSRVLRRDYWGEYAMTLLYDLHYRLLLEEPGGRLLGWLGFGLLALLASGLWAWWPRGSWRKALRVKPGASPLRQLRDWHKLAGLSGIALLLVLTGTGMMLELPRESDALLTAGGLNVDPMPHPHALSLQGAPISTSGAMRAGRAAMPGARLAWIETPGVQAGHFRLRMQVPGDPSWRFPHSYLWLDASSREVLAVHDLRRLSAGSMVNGWTHALHDGSAGGLPGRLLVAMCGLLPAALLATGMSRWRRSMVSRTGTGPVQRRS